MVAALLLALASPAAAKNWNANSGPWSVAANWTPVGTPAAGELTNIAFTNGVARTVTLDTNTPALSDR
jgi:hypothetical protein